MNQYLMVWIFFFPLYLSAQEADIRYSCEAPDRILEEIRQADRDSIDSLSVKYDGDFWVQRAYIDLKAKNGRLVPNRIGMPENTLDASVIERFRKEYESQPGNSQAAYLYAYALIHTDTEASIKILTDLTETDPSFPTAWMTLAILSNYSDLKDQNKTRHYTEEFLARCPDTVDIEIAGLALKLDRSDIVAAYMKALRERIAGNPDQTLFPLYRFLWKLESAFALPGEEDALKEKIREDLAFLEGMANKADRGLKFVLMSGYEQIGDKAALNELRSQELGFSELVALPLFAQAFKEWSAANPAPAPGAEEAMCVAYYRKQLRFLNQWRDRLPEYANLLGPWFTSLASLPEIPDEVLIKEGDRILEILHHSDNSASIAAAMNVLQAWTQRNLALDRVPSLVHEFMASQSLTPIRNNPMESTGQASGPTYTTSILQEYGQWIAKSSAWPVLVTAHIKTQQYHEAHNALSEWRIAFEAWRERAKIIRDNHLQKTLKAQNSSPPSRQPNVKESAERSIISGMIDDELKFNEACAHLAEAESRFLDALIFYQLVLRLTYVRYASAPDLMDLDAGKSAHFLWFKLGGSQAGWDAWIESVKTAGISIILSTP